MSKQSPHGLIAKASGSLLEQEVRLDLRLLGKSLVAGSIDALKGDWHGSARRLGEAVVGGLGLKDDSSDVLA